MKFRESLPANLAFEQSKQFRGLNYRFVITQAELFSACVCVEYWEVAGKRPFWIANHLGIENCPVERMLLFAMQSVLN